MVSIYVANLRAYNENEAVGKWIDLPCVGLREKVEALTWNERIQDFNDYGIQDYEAPFGIKEYEDIYELNRKAEALKEMKESIPETQIVSLLEMMDIDELFECYEDLEIVEGSEYKDLAYYLVDERGLLEGSPAYLRNYFDYEGYGRDLVLDGDYVQVTGYFVRVNGSGESPLFLLAANGKRTFGFLVPKVLFCVRMASWLR